MDPLADLFGGPSSAPAAAAASNDPFAGLGLSNGGAAPVAAAGAAATAAGVAGGDSPGEFKLSGDIVSWRQALLFKERGILYEDSFLQVGEAWVTLEKDRNILQGMLGVVWGWPSFLQVGGVQVGRKTMLCLEEVLGVGWGWGCWGCGAGGGILCKDTFLQAGGGDWLCVAGVMLLVMVQL